MPLPRPWVALLATLAVTSGTLAVATAGAHAAAALPALVVTEINVDSTNRTTADGASVDAFEFVEVRNTTDAAIDLADAGYSVVYLSGSTQKTLTHPAGTTVPAGPCRRWRPRPASPSRPPTPTRSSATA